jgi:hypothetical protein
MTDQILQSFYVKSTKNLSSDFFGSDDPDVSKINSKFPHSIHYNFNSRGYRDSEWPDSLPKLKTAIWCLGDSATVGVGSPLAHTWPNLLSTALQRRTINISMVAASNDFIERKCIELLNTIAPDLIVICWSYLSRRDVSEQFRLDFIQKREALEWNNFYTAIRDPSWPDCENFASISNLPNYIQQEITNCYRPLIINFDDEMWRNYQDNDLSQQQSARRTADQEVEYFMQKIRNIKQHQQSTKILHTFVPDYGTAEEKLLVQQQFQNLGLFYYKITQLDQARDKIHWDVKTSQLLVDRLIEEIKMQ